MAGTVWAAIAGKPTISSLADGTPIHSPSRTRNFSGEIRRCLARAQTSSLLDYASGADLGRRSPTAVSVRRGDIGQFAVAVVQGAAQQTGAAGITDQRSAGDAVRFWAATGDPIFLSAGAFAIGWRHDDTSQHRNTATVTPSIGVGAALNNLTETQGGGPTNVRIVYLTAPASHDTVVNWAVTSPGAGYLGAGAFGGTAIRRRADRGRRDEHERLRCGRRQRVWDGTQRYAANER